MVTGFHRVHVVERCVPRPSRKYTTAHKPHAPCCDTVLFAVALQLGPMSVLASCFTTLLIFNMLFARVFLGEELTRAKVATTPDQAPLGHCRVGAVLLLRAEHGAGSLSLSSMPGLPGARQPV